MGIFQLSYKHIVRPALFRFDPESVHEFALASLRHCRTLKPLIQPMLNVHDQRFHQTIWGYTFKNPIGLAGGFDKNAVCTEIWDLFGFSFVEVGTITPRPQSGNPKPRLFRYPDEEAIVNRMGFNNDGAEAVAERLRHQPRRNVILGISLGKQKETPIHDMDAVIHDYTKSFETLYSSGDFFTVNVSSPNTEQLRDLQHGELLQSLLTTLLETRNRLEESDPNQIPKPLCVKFAPDLTEKELLTAIEIALEAGIDGIIATNTTNQTGERETGGLSGKPLRKRSTEVIHLVAQKVQGKIPIIGCGGIFTAEDAIEKLEAGASLLQIYTGFIYQGPMIVKEILKGLIRNMNIHEYEHLQEIPRK